MKANRTIGRGSLRDPQPPRRKTHPSRRGAGLVIALTTLLVVMLMTGALLRDLVTNHRRNRHATAELQALWLADAAAARAQAHLRIDPQYVGETWRAAVAGSVGEGQSDVGVAEIRVERLDEDPASARLTIEARYPDHAVRRAAVSRSCLIPVAAKQTSAGRRPEEDAP